MSEAITKVKNRSEIMTELLEERREWLKGEDCDGECGMEHKYSRLNLHAKALGKLGGKVKSEAKAATSRKNDKLGGRPRKQKCGWIGCNEPVEKEGLCEVHNAVISPDY